VNWQRSQSLWDGKRTLTLTAETLDSPFSRLTISSVCDMDALGMVTGSEGSIRLTRERGVESSNQWFDAYLLAPSIFEQKTIKLSRVFLADGREALELELRPDLPALPAAQKQYHLYWFDEKRGYALLGNREGNDLSPFDFVENFVEEIKEVAPGIFYPAKTRGIIFPGDDDQSTYQWTATILEANQPIAETYFLLQLPKLQEVVYTPHFYEGKPAATQAGDWVTKPGEGFTLP